jgi:AcrR family transcriptional regulator
MSAVAARAGVQRQTVYRHFPTELELFRACSGHFFAAHPWPDTARFAAVADPRERLAAGLDDVYAWYERTGPMLRNVHRDAALVEAVPPSLVPLQTYLRDAASVLLVGWPVRGARRRVLAAAIRHALDVRTWDSLAGDGDVPRAEAVRLVSALVERAAST